MYITRGRQHADCGGADRVIGRSQAAVAYYLGSGRPPPVIQGSSVGDILDSALHGDKR